MQVLLFAGLVERFGSRVLELPDPIPANVSELRTRLLEVWPDAARTEFRVAVNQSYVDDAHALRSADEVALIPPVSGG